MPGPSAAAISLLPTWPAAGRIMGFQGAMQGWRLVDTNTIGEFSVGLILKRSFGTENGQDAAKHWAGDQVITLERESSIGVIWMIAFDSDWAAARFAAAYVTPLDDALGGTMPHRIDYRGNAVLVLIGDPADRFDTIGPSIWAASLISHH